MKGESVDASMIARKFALNPSQEEIRRILIQERGVITYHRRNKETQ